MIREGNDHEVILLGSGLGGLIAGTLLAKKGHSVLLLKEREYQSSYQQNGYRFTPFSTFSEKRLRPSLVQRISQELGLSITRKLGKRFSIQERGWQIKRKGSLSSHSAEGESGPF